MANIADKERITIDNAIHFSNENDDKTLQKLVVIEIKKLKNNMDSAVNQLLKSNGIRPTSFSKYAIGSALMNPKLKYNRFKKQIILPKYYSQWNYLALIFMTQKT